MRPATAKSGVASGALLYPDEPLDAALRLLSIEPVVEVVSRLEPDEVLGTLTLDDVHRAYGITSSTMESNKVG